MQGRLVDHRTVDHGGAIGVVGEAQSVEPCRPPRLEMPLEADLVVRDGVVTAGGAPGVVSIGWSSAVTLGPYERTW